MVPLTEQAHRIIEEVVREGETVVDATAGNGHDTLFLAGQVGISGRVYSLDIQAEAVRRTAAGVRRQGLENVVLIEGDHAQLDRLLPDALHGRVGAVMFNLGYLPGGDKKLTTRTCSTLRGLEAALGMLRPGGLVSILAYVGHPGGQEEAEAIEEFLGELPERWHQLDPRPAVEPSSLSPRLYAVRLHEPVRNSDRRCVSGSAGAVQR